MIGKTVSHYTITEEIGRGGMGVVYEAEDVRLGRTVALKFLPPLLTQDPEARARFVQEARAASALDHPNICTIYEIDETADGETFIAMAYYEGETLSARIARGPLGLDDAVDIAIQITAGLREAHEKDIVHRDIKPSNIMLTSKGQAKIMDFGVAKLAAGTHLTREGSTLGTTAYMSPEQARGLEIDHHSDIWSLGAVLYEMLTGQRPFRGDYSQAVIYAILNESPEPLTAVRSDVPLELERIVGKAMAKEPADRYQHVEEMTVDLRAAGRAKISGTVGIGVRTSGMPGRKRLYLFGGLLVILALLFTGLHILLSPHSEIIDSIAVLPLKNLSGSPEQDYFADGMTEALITELTRIHALRVISRTSVMRFKETVESLPEIARMLGVDAVVEGSAMFVGNRVRITAQLIEAKNDRHLWADDYDRQLENILSLQKEVARTIAQEVRATLTPQEQSLLNRANQIDPAAHEAYLKGCYHNARLSEESARRAIEYFDEAIEIEPEFAQAYIGKAYAYDVLGSLGGAAGETWPLVKATALKALEIDGSLGEAQALIADVEFIYEWEFERAEQAFKRAIEMSPGYAEAHSWYSLLLAALSRGEEAVPEAKRAVELDPLTVGTRANAAAVYSLANRWGEGLHHFQVLLEYEPDHPFLHNALANYYMTGYRGAEAIEVIEKWCAASGDSLDQPFMALAYAQVGDTRRARELLGKLIDMAERGRGLHTVVACTYVVLGEDDRAFEWLERGYRDRDKNILFVNASPRFERIRSDPRFTDLVKRIGLER